jgi:RNA 2',3'-cyclic 3'-phosphodiesterase
MSNKRLFLALWPDDRQRNKLRDTFRPLLSSIEGKMIDRRNWHVTLVFIGEFPDSSVPELLLKIAHVEVQPFRLRFDRLSFFARPKIACLQAMTVPDELRLLKSDLETVLLPFNVAPENLEYRPHITAVRAARPFQLVRLARPLELHWSGFELVESISMPGSIQYRPLKQQLRSDS